jgi:hypothetical protein
MSEQAQATQVAEAKTLGRNQRIAIVASAVLAAIPVAPTVIVMSLALYRGDQEIQLATIDRLFSFVTSFGPTALGIVLGAAALVKGTQAVAGAITSRGQQP